MKFNLSKEMRKAIMFFIETPITSRKCLEGTIVCKKEIREFAFDLLSKRRPFFAKDTYADTFRREWRRIILISYKSLEDRESICRA